MRILDFCYFELSTKITKNLIIFLYSKNIKHFVWFSDSKNCSYQRNQFFLNITLSV